MVKQEHITLLQHGITDWNRWRILHPDTFPDLSDANLKDADLSNAVIGFTTFGNVDLQSVKGLRTVEQHGPSIKYCTCFISYSSKDTVFAQILEAYLETSGILCWFAPLEMQPGDWIPPTLVEAIKEHDKPILILSENSIKSEWVKFEVEIAQSKESESEALVLFPISIDEAISPCTEGWAPNFLSRACNTFISHCLLKNQRNQPTSNVSREARVTCAAPLNNEGWPPLA